MEKVFDSNDFPARDALSAWQKVTSEAVMPTSFKVIGTDVFRGWFSTMPLGAVQISAMAYSSHLTQRTPKLIRASDPEILALGVTTSGPHVIEQNRNRADLRPGELLLFDSSHTPSRPTPMAETPSSSFPARCFPYRPATSISSSADPFPVIRAWGSC
ncbi:hypothetical protein [Streptomyces javensis]|uniref:AraC-like ligand-binding domain-containing protein n=1 Tax=Streptomyces javensis TaxID=114698 RepID=UPI0031F74343